MHYKFPEIRKFINEALSDNDLDELCHDYFYAVYNQFTSGQSKGQRVLALVAYVRQNGQEDMLLQKLEGLNPGAYANRKDELTSESEDEGSPSSQTSSAASGDDYISDFEELLGSKNDAQVRRTLIAESQRMVEAIGEIDKRQHPVKSGSFGSNEFLDAVGLWEIPGGKMRQLLAAFCHSGQLPMSQPIVGCIENVSDPGNSLVPSSVWLGLKLYPALLLTYVSGIAALASDNYDLLAALLTRPAVRDLADMRSLEDKPLVLVVNQHHVFGKYLTWLPEANSSIAPASARIYQLAWNILRQYIPNEATYKKSFERFEYLFALVYADLYDKALKKRTNLDGFFGQPLIGSYLYDNYTFRTAFPAQVPPLVKEFGDELMAPGADSPVLRAGLFDGSAERLQLVIQEMDVQIKELIAKVRSP